MSSIFLNEFKSWEINQIASCQFFFPQNICTITLTLSDLRLPFICAITCFLPWSLKFNAIRWSISIFKKKLNCREKLKNLLLCHFYEGFTFFSEQKTASRTCSRLSRLTSDTEDLHVRCPYLLEKKQTFCDLAVSCCTMSTGDVSLWNYEVVQFGFQ